MLVNYFNILGHPLLVEYDLGPVLHLNKSSQGRITVRDKSGELLAILLPENVHIENPCGELPTVPVFSAVNYYISMRSKIDE